MNPFEIVRNLVNAVDVCRPALRRWCAGIGDLEALVRKVQWLHAGMNDAQVTRAPVQSRHWALRSARKLIWVYGVVSRDFAL